LEKTIDCQKIDVADGREVYKWFDRVGISYRLCKQCGEQFYTIYELPHGWTVQEMSGYLYLLDDQEVSMANIDIYDSSILIEVDW
jgi:hypothetical protein